MNESYNKDDLNKAILETINLSEEKFSAATEQIIIKNPENTKILSFLLDLCELRKDFDIAIKMVS